MKVAPEPKLATDKNYYEYEGDLYVRITHAMSRAPKPWLDQWRKKVGDEEADRIADETSRDGNLIHEVTEMHDRGQVDRVKELISQNAWLIPYWVAWKRWTAERIEKWVWIEKAVIHRTLGMGGRLDRMGVFKGDPYPTIIDIKSTSSLSNGMGIQLCAYRSMALDTIDRLKLSADLVPERTVIVHLPGPRWIGSGEDRTTKTDFDSIVVKEYDWRKYRNDMLDCVNEFWALAR